MIVLPDYLIAGVVAPPPEDCGVLPMSTPVVAFGNARVARVATLGLNPSRVEFLDSRGDELVGAARRLATRTSLGREANVPFTNQDAVQIIADCDNYFGTNPYTRWFNVLEGVLRPAGASYFAGAVPACHLDVSRWATDPVWGKLARSQQQLLADDGRAFLRAQLANESIEVLLVNGAGAFRPIRDSVRLARREHLDACELTIGSFEGVRVVAWSTNLQSSFGVTNDFRRRLSDRVATLSSLD